MRMSGGGSSASSRASRSSARSRPSRPGRRRAALAGGPGVSPEPELVRLNTALTRLAEQLKPALVQIRVRRQTEEPDPEDGPAARARLGLRHSPRAATS